MELVNRTEKLLCEGGEGRTTESVPVDKFMPFNCKSLQYTPYCQPHTIEDKLTSELFRPSIFPL